MFAGASAHLRAVIDRPLHPANAGETRVVDIRFLKSALQMVYSAGYRGDALRFPGILSHPLWNSLSEVGGDVNRLCPDLASKSSDLSSVSSLCIDTTPRRSDRPNPFQRIPDIHPSPHNNGRTKMPTAPASALDAGAVRIRVMRSNRNTIGSCPEIPFIQALSGVSPSGRPPDDHSVIAHTRAGRPVAPSNLGQAANSTAPAGATLSRLHSTSICSLPLAST